MDTSLGLDVLHGRALPPPALGVQPITARHLIDVKPLADARANLRLADDPAQLRLGLSARQSDAAAGLALGADPALDLPTVRAPVPVPRRPAGSVGAD